MEHPRCPFYPESCEVERHANMAHRWKVDRTAKAVARAVTEPTIKVAMKRELGQILPLPVTKHVTKLSGVTKVGRPRVTNSDAERQAAYRRRLAEKKLAEKE